MATEIVQKKKQSQEMQGKSKGLNTTIWILVILLFSAAAVGNVYFEKIYSTPVRVVAVAVALLIAFILAAITNQGTRARAFARDARSELRRVVWPTRQEARQTTLLIIGVTVFSSLIFWAMDSIIVTVINFLTGLRF